MRVFPIIVPHETIAPYYGIITMIEEALGYLTTKLGDGTMGDNQKRF